MLAVQMIIYLIIDFNVSGINLNLSFKVHVAVDLPVRKSSRATILAKMLTEAETEGKQKKSPNLR